MKMRLNVASRPVEGHRRFVAGAVVGAVIGLGALAVLSSSVYRAWRENRGERGEIAGYEAKLDRLHADQVKLSAYFQSAQTKTVMDRATFLNSLIDQRSFPWTKIFIDLEKVLPAGVHVVRIAPKMSKGRVDVELVVDAFSQKSATDFLQELQSSPAFTAIEVNAVGPATEAGQGDVEEIRLDAIYTGAGEER